MTIAISKGTHKPGQAFQINAEITTPVTSFTGVAITGTDKHCILSFESPLRPPKEKRGLYEASHKDVYRRGDHRSPTPIRKKRATIGRPYKQISAEILFSLPICFIMGLTKSLPPRGRWHGIAVTEGACVTLDLWQLHCNVQSLTRLRRELPPWGSLWECATLGVWALPEAVVIQWRNWR